MDKDYLAKEIRNTLDENTAQWIMNRSDKYAENITEQLNKSTDRSYTLFGIMVTAFAGLTALLLSSLDKEYFLIPGIVLWLGLFVSNIILFNKAIWVYPMKFVGSEPHYMASKNNMEIFKNQYSDDQDEGNYKYRKLLIASSIQDDQAIIQENIKTLKKRVTKIQLAMNVIKITVGLVALITIVELFLFWRVS